MELGHKVRSKVPCFVLFVDTGTLTAMVAQCLSCNRNGATVLCDTTMLFGS